MPVKLDVDRFYREHADPWSIGAARSPRYDLYSDLLLEHASDRRRLLDVGCGMGAFLARFRDEFAILEGLEISRVAISRGREHHPFIEFHQGSAARPPDDLSNSEPRDAIIYSDVINYLSEREKRRSLEWIARRLSRPNGVALIAGWAPGGDYLTPHELRRMVGREFAIRESRLLESGHALMLAEPKRFMVALTVDYETWHPIPAGRRIDWECDVFAPAAALMDVADRHGAAVTFMAELGEHEWLEHHEPDVASRMANQWREAVRRGHDVQAHLHPNWLPELGARREGDTWIWDWSVGRAHDYPGDLGALLDRLRRRLEGLLRLERPEYSTVAFRAGAYETQPFARLHRALSDAGFRCDSSVHRGGRRDDRSYDYRLAFSAHQPYAASAYDPQLRAAANEAWLLELPVLALSPGVTWTLDPLQGRDFARQLLEHCARSSRSVPSTPAARRRERARAPLRTAYTALGPRRGVINRVLPRRLAHALAPAAIEPRPGHEYFVSIGHTKMDLDFDSIEHNLARLAADGRFELLRLADLVAAAERDLAAARRDELAAMQAAEPLWGSPSHTTRVAAAGVVPLDRRHVLTAGPGTVACISGTFPWMTVSETATDVRPDCAVLTGLEQAPDVDRRLAEAQSALANGGVLVLAVPSGARGPDSDVPGWSWRTAPDDVRDRLLNAGFERVEVGELDAFRELGGLPSPACGDRVTVARAWKQGGAPDAGSRVDTLARALYEHLDPSRAQTTDNPLQILAEGVAWCSGYSVALGEALLREGYGVEWISMVARDHPRGRGQQRLESHEVLQVEHSGGRREVVDAMVGVRFPSGVRALLTDPLRADGPRMRDERYRMRDYDLYATSAWYAGVTGVCVKRHPRDVLRYASPERFLSSPDRAPATRSFGAPPRSSTPAAVRLRWLAHRLAQRSPTKTMLMLRNSRSRGSLRSRS